MNTSPLVRVVALVGCLLVLACMGALLTEADVRPAATLTVTTTADAGPGSLRDALANANDGDEIAFALSTPATITLTSGELVIEDDLTITGPGAELLAISGDRRWRVIQANRPITLTGLTVCDGTASEGGGVRSSSNEQLVLVEVVVRDNYASTQGGGVHATNMTLTGTQIISNTSGQKGGGFYCEKRALMSDTAVCGNVAGHLGGGGWAEYATIDRSCLCDNVASSSGGLYVFLDLILHDSTLSGNRVSTGGGGGATTVRSILCIDSDVISNTSDYGGGGLCTNGHATIYGSRVMSNTTAGAGGGVYALSGVTVSETEVIGNVTSGEGGGVWGGSGHAYVIDSIVRGNMTRMSGGGVFGYTSVRVEGSQIISNTNRRNGPGVYCSRGPVTVVDSDISHNLTTNGAGGGVWSYTTAVLTDTRVANNSVTSRGGGIKTRKSAFLYDCDVLSNTAEYSGGGLYTEESASIHDGTRIQGNNALGSGGGLYVTGELVVADTLIAINTAGVDGGGAYCVSPAGFDNVTVYSNTSRTCGGGIYGSIVLTLTDCALEANRADEDGGALYVTGADRLNLTDTDVVSNTAQFGGGILLKEMGEVEIVGGRIGGNVAQETGAGISNGGETEHLTVDRLRLIGVLLDQNESLGDFGYNLAGGSIAGGVTALSLEDCDITDNTTAGCGGGVGVSCASMSVSGTLFERNHSDHQGGALNLSGHLAMTNTQIVSNTCDGEGGGAWVMGDARIHGSLLEGNVAGNWAGALWSGFGRLEMTDTDLVDNSADDLGAANMQGGILDQVRVFRNTARGEVGGILATSRVTIAHSSFVSNTASGMCGAIECLYGATVSDSLFQENRATVDGPGAIVSHFGHLILENTGFLSNTGATDGGAVLARHPLSMDGCYAGGNHSNASGGAVSAQESATIVNSTFYSNTATEDGGGLHAHGDLVITDTALVSNTSGRLGGGAFVDGNVIATGTRFEGNTAASGDGGMCTTAPDWFHMTNCQFIRNFALGGGALNPGESHDKILDRCLFQENSTDIGCGACCANSPLRVTNSAFVSNTASMIGTLAAVGGLHVENTTFVGNETTGEGSGAVYADDHSPVHLTNCTISGNRATMGAGGIWSGRGWDLGTLTNTIVAGNTSATGSPDLSGAYTSGGYNLIGIADGATGFTDGVNGDLVGTAAAPLDPLLGPVGDYGGVTPTLPLLPGSPAIDAAGYAAPTLDQRGAPRVGRADMGAFEAQGFVLAAASGDGQSAALGQPFAEALTVRVASAKGDPVDGGVVTFAAPEIGASALLSATTAQIVDGLASVSATANGIAGTYEVEARARGARPERIWRPQVLPLDEPTVPVTPSPTTSLTATSTLAPTASPTATLEPPVEEPLVFTLTNVDGTVTPDEGVWLPLIVRR